MTVELAAPGGEVAGTLWRDRRDEGRHPLGAGDRPGQVAQPAEASFAGPAVCHEHGVLSEQGDEIVHLAGSGGVDEGPEQPQVLFAGRGEHATLGRHVVARPSQQLPAGGLGLLHDRGDLAVTQIEHVVKHQHGPL